MNRLKPSRKEIRAIPSTPSAPCVYPPWLGSGTWRAVAVCVLALAGCGTKTAPLAAPPPTVAQTPAPQDEPPVEQPAEATAGGSAQASEPEPKPEPAPEPKPEATQEPKPEPQPEPKPAPKTATGERIVLLTAGAPLLIELRITLDGRPPSASFDEVVASLLKSSDRDQDGRTTWDELADNPAIRRGSYGNMPINSPQELSQFIEQYDLNDNHVVDGDELPRIFARGGQAGRAVSIRNLLDNQQWNRVRSPLFQTLDRDANGTLNADELASVATILGTLDTDDDERLQPFELTAAPPPAMGDGMAMRRRSQGPTFAWRLTDRTNWDALLRAYQETYALGGLLRPDCFAARPTLYTRLDQNSNGYLSGAELQQLLTLDPDVTVEIAWGKTERPAWALLHVSEELGPRDAIVTSLPEGAILQLATAQIELFQREVAMSSSDDQARQVIMTYDTNQNAYLDGDEITQTLAALNLDLEAVDTNEDREIPFEELAEYFRKQTAAAASQVQIQANHREDALWTFLDANRDGQLDGQELKLAAARLKQLDRDNSDDVTWEELPDAVVVAIARGVGTDAPLRPQPVMARAAAESAPWFQAMDANRDGTISRREFLGDASQFDSLDANRDGSLTWAECAAPG